MPLARRNLFQDKTRLALSVGGVALAVMLILLLQGLLSGMYAQISAYLEHAPGTLVVAQDGVTNPLGATSLLPPGTLGDVKAKGASRVVPLLSQFAILDLHGKKQPVYLVGYERARGGGPWQLAAGREPRRDTEVAFDRVLAERHGLTLGDKVEIMDRDFTIVGPSDRLTAAQLRERLSHLSNVEVLFKHEMIANDLKLFARLLSAPLQLMVGIAFLVGTLIVGLVIYTATVERQREYGVLRAIGARNAMLYRVVATQAVIASGAGSALGVGLALGSAELIINLRPEFLMVTEPGMITRALIVGLAMALLAALFPARIIAGLAPAEVFRK